MTPHTKLKPDDDMRTLAIGDIHGNYKALMQCFERSKFDDNKDRLIVLGDVYDSFPDSSKCVEELMKIEDLIWIKGNHDEWVRMWFEDEWEESPLNEIGWLSQGGYNTKESYHSEQGEFDQEMFNRHKEFIKNMVLYHIDIENRLYVHAGINWSMPIEKQKDQEIYYWDRLTYTLHSLVHQDKGTTFPYKEVFIGHTDTTRDDPTGNPVKRANLWNLDQGAGWRGKMTIMDVDTHEYWQSDWNTERRR